MPAVFYEVLDSVNQTDHTNVCHKTHQVTNATRPGKFESV